MRWGQLPPVPALSQELEDEVAPESDDSLADEEEMEEPPTPQPSPALMQASQRMRDLPAECEGQEKASPTVQALQRTWRRMLDSWEADLYHCYDIEGLPCSKLGIEALFGRARRQQRRLRGQSDTSPLAVTGQGYLRTDSEVSWLCCRFSAWFISAS